MFGSLLLLSYTHLSARKIIGHLKFRSQLCVSDPTILLPRGGQAGGHAGGMGVVSVTCFVTDHTDALKCNAIPMVSTHSKIFKPNSECIPFYFFFTFIKPLDTLGKTDICELDTDKMRNTRSASE